MFPENKEEDATSGLKVAGEAPATFAVSGLSAAQAARDAQLAQMRVDQQVEANRKLLMDAASRLREQRVGPSRAEQLFALSRALTSPTRTGSFAETLGNVGGALGEQAKARRAAEFERAQLLEKYGTAAGAEALKALQARANLANQMYGSAAQLEAARVRANRPNWTVVPPGGSLVDTNLPVYTVEEAVELGKDPANRGKKFRTIDGRTGVL